jgi:hypothetical protein
VTAPAPGRGASAAIATGLLFVAGLSWFGVNAGSSVIDAEDHWRARWQALAAGRPGFVVWESVRDGRWRIYRRNLDGTGLRRLSPDEPGRDHFCPHLSPDGTRLVYLSYPAGRTAYYRVPDGELVPMHLMNADGTGDRIVADSARAYFEDRAAVWLDRDRVVYIDGQGQTHELDLRTGERTPLTWGGRDENGWLVSPTKTHADTGWATFSEYDASTKNILQKPMLGGCQPYFSRDGVWGYWMSGLGGPISRYRLATGESAPILLRYDPRMPSGRSYVYFPMLSSCQTLFAFAASPKRHDHFRSDYDVFVAPVDPFTLELVGEPLRYSFDKACDRFPDVFVEEIALGHVRGSPPLRVALGTPGMDSTWTWDFGDGTPAAAGTGEHTYVAAGRYEVTARRGDEVRRGRVLVDPAEAGAAPPAALPAWPKARDGLVFAFETADQTNVVVDAATGRRTTFPLTRRGLAHHDRRHALVLRGGTFASADAGERIARASAASGELGVEAVVGSRAPASTILACGDAAAPWLALRQDGERLFVVLRAADGADARAHEIGRLPAGEGHVAIALRPTELVAWIDGGETARVAPSPPWSPAASGPLVFGGNGEAGWHGTLSRIAVYARALTEQTVAESLAAARDAAAAVPPTRRVTAHAKLVARSAPPTLEEIQPYRDALAVHEYEITSSEPAGALPTRVRVAHWVLLDGEPLPAGGFAVGSTHELVLEPFDGQPQLRSIFRADKLEEDFDVELWHDVGG